MRWPPAPKICSPARAQTPKTYLVEIDQTILESHTRHCAMAASRPLGNRRLAIVAARSRHLI
jgi:hypothetical protein